MTVLHCPRCLRSRGGARRRPQRGRGGVGAAGNNGPRPRGAPLGTMGGGGLAGMGGTLRLGAPCWGRPPSARRRAATAPPLPAPAAVGPVRPRGRRARPPAPAAAPVPLRACARRRGGAAARRAAAGRAAAPRRRAGGAAVSQRGGGRASSGKGRFSVAWPRLRPWGAAFGPAPAGEKPRRREGGGVEGPCGAVWVEGDGFNAPVRGGASTGARVRRLARRRARHPPRAAACLPPATRAPHDPRPPRGHAHPQTHRARRVVCAPVKAPLRLHDTCGVPKPRVLEAQRGGLSRGHARGGGRAAQMQSGALPRRQRARAGGGVRVPLLAGAPEAGGARAQHARLPAGARGTRLRAARPTSSCRP
jgi:hypothetical protein